jgi:hypothetical protein
LRNAIASGLRPGREFRKLAAIGQTQFETADILGNLYFVGNFNPGSRVLRLPFHPSPGALDSRLDLD